MEQKGVDGSSTPSHNTSSSPLLRLPRELRDLIWTFTFTHTVQPFAKKLFPTTKPPFSLLYTCRQINSETRQLAYSCLTWSFRNRIQYEDWFYEIPPEKRHLVYSIQLGVDTIDMYAQAEVEDPGYDDEEVEQEEEEFRTPTFRAFPNLKRLELLVSHTAVEDEEEYQGRRTKWYNLDEVNESRDNFNETMKKKNPRVEISYKVFRTYFEMRLYWIEQAMSDMVRDYDGWVQRLS